MSTLSSDVLTDASSQIRQTEWAETDSVIELDAS